MAPQEKEVEELNQGMEINKDKIKKIEWKFNDFNQEQSNIVFELAEVSNPPKEPDLPQFGKDRSREEDRPSQYVILVKGGKKQRRLVVEETTEEAEEDLEIEPEQSITISHYKRRGFVGLPAQLQKQLEVSGFNQDQIDQHPEQVLQVLSYASK